MVGKAGEPSGARRRLRRPGPLGRLGAIHAALASGRNEQAARLIAGEAARLVHAPAPAGVYWAAADGAFVLARSGQQPTAAPPRALQRSLIEAARRACARGASMACVALPADSSSAVARGAAALLPVLLSGELGAILMVPLPARRITWAQQTGLRLLAGLLPLALRQAPPRLPRLAQGDDEALKRVVAGVAHELNNPLAIIAGYAQVLLAGEVAEELRPDLERIDRAARRAARVLRDLLAFAREQPMAPTLFAVESLVHDALAAERAALETGGIGLSVEIAPDLPLIRGDRLQLTQVLVHLIGHARRSIVGHPGASRIAIRASGGDERTHLSLSDDGPGIAPELLDKVFEPFVASQEGGMMLAVCQSIVRAHGGHIWAANNPAGGSTFHIELPAGS